MKFSPSKSEPIQFQLAPMIDVVFLLLCFFITSMIYAQWETEIDIELPTAESGATPQRLAGEIIINVFADGSTVVNQRHMDPGELDVFLSRISDLFPDQAVVIRSDQNTPFVHVMRVMDLSRVNGIRKISFATRFAD